MWRMVTMFKFVKKAAVTIFQELKDACGIFLKSFHSGEVRSTSCINWKAIQYFREHNRIKNADLICPVCILPYTGL